jgi:hypothetical protein
MKNTFVSVQEASNSFMKLGEALNKIPKEEMDILEKSVNSFSFRSSTNSLIEKINQYFSFSYTKKS